MLLAMMDMYWDQVQSKKPYRFDIKIRPRATEGLVKEARKRWFNQGAYYAQGVARTCG